MDAKWFKKICTVSEELLLPAMTRQRYGHVAQALHFALRPLFFSFLFPNFLIFLFSCFLPEFFHLGGFGFLVSLLILIGSSGHSCPPNPSWVSLAMPSITASIRPN